MTKFAKKHLSRCVGLYLVGAVAIGAGVAVYDMPSAYAFSDGAYSRINKNINREEVTGLSVGTYDAVKDEYAVTIYNEKGDKSIIYMTEADLGDGKLDLSKLEFGERDNALDIDIPAEMTLVASGELGNGANSPINVKSDAKLTLEGDTTITGQITVDKNKILNVKADASSGQAVTLTGKAPIVNGGTIVTEGANIAAPIENQGIVTAGTGTTIDGTITNASAGVIKATDATIAGKVTNQGKIEASNNATITGEITNQGTIDASTATIAGTIKNDGTMSLSDAKVDGAITGGESSKVEIKGDITGTGKVQAATVSVTGDADLSSMNSLSATSLEVADGQVNLGKNIQADTLKLEGTGAKVEGEVAAKTVSVSETYQANKNLSLSSQNKGETLQIIVDTKDPEIAKKVVAEQVAKSMDADKIVISTTEGATSEIKVEKNADGTINTDKLEEDLKNTEFDQKPITPDTPPTPPVVDPDETELLGRLADGSAYDVFAKDADDKFLDNDDLKLLQAIDQRDGTSYYKNAMRNLQKVVSPTIATRQSMNVLNSVSLGNVSDRLDSIRTARGHVGVYPEDSNVKGAREDKTGNLWASIKHGDTDIDDTANVKYNYYQIGYDHQVGDTTYIGAFVGTATGDVTTNGMKSDIDSAWDFGLYGTRLLPQGQYFNLVGKYGKMTNKYRTAEWDNKGYNVALEYGQKIQQPAGFTITPYVQLVYDHASDSTVSGVYVPMYLDSSNAWNAKIGAKFEDEDAYGNNVYGGIAYSKGIGGSYTAMVNGIRLPDVDNDLGVIFINLGIQHKMSDSSYFDLRVEKEMLDYDGWNVQGVVNFAF